MIDGYACATERGRKYHMTRNEPCRICREWWEKVQAGTATAAVRSKAQVAQCGTVSGYNRHRKNGEAACKPCREASNKASRDNKAKKRAADGRLLNELKPHGTVAAYQRHKRAGEEPCEPCKQAQREKSDARRVRNPRVLAPCGTVSASHRHYRAKEPLCDPCRVAVRANAVERYRAKPPNGPGSGSPKTEIDHGTVAGRQQHRRRGEQPCDLCREAQSVYDKKYNQERRKAA